MESQVILAKIYFIMGRIKLRWYFISILFLFGFLWVACSVSPVAISKPAANINVSPDRSHLEDLGQAPELSNRVWLNVEQPLRLADLRGQVVLLEMWTFG